MSKIYLSLDDLHKLYGISPAVISAIKKKRNKRRNKKNKINNNNMNNKKSSSDHMVGSGGQIVNDLKQLKIDKIKKHIDDINNNNKVILEGGNNNINDKNDKEFNQFMQMKSSLGSGVLSVTKLPNGFTIKNPALNKKVGRKSNTIISDEGKKEKRVELLSTPMNKKSNIVNKRDNTGISSKTNDSSDNFKAPEIQNTLLNNTSNLMGQNFSFTPAISLDDGSGNIASGTGSDKFQIIEPVDLPPVEEKTDDTTVDQTVEPTVEPPEATQYIPTPIKEYAVSELENIAQLENIDIYEFQKQRKGADKKVKRYTKQQLYEELVKLELV